MKAVLTFKRKDPWSGFKVYNDCKHAITSYIMRSGVRYTGLNGSENDVVRTRLEKELGVDLRPHSTYWDNFAIFLGTQDVRLDTDVPEQELKYHFLKGHKRVALGLSDTKASTDYVLLQAEEEAKEANTKARLRRRALVEFEKLTPEDMRKALRLYGYSASSNSPEVVEDTLFKLVEENPKKFLMVWVDNKTKDTEYLIEEACSKSILRKQNTVYKYGSDVIGYTLGEAVSYLENPANRDLKVTIMAQMEGKEVTFGDKKQEATDTKSQYSKLLQEIAEAEKVTEEVEEVEEESKPKKQTKTKN